MPRRTVYNEVMDVLERRIESGEYMLKDLPGERRLAEEVGVSYMTARKAVQKLIEKKVLTRGPSGALEVHPSQQASSSGLSVAMLTPAYPSPVFARFRLALSRAAEMHGAQFRPVEYLHWDDSVVRQALDGADGLVIVPSTEDIPERVTEAFRSASSKVVFFDADMTAHGLPSMGLFASSHILSVFDHLWKLGHRRIDCLNTQGHNDEIERRISLWQTWLERKGGDGRLYDNPAAPYEDPLPRAHLSMHDVLKKHDHALSALVCTTQPAALGAVRACYEAGVSVGEQISICTMNNEPTGRYYCPSLTGLEMPDLEPMLEQVFEWFESPQREWPGPLLLEPEEARLFRGESTGAGKG